jgi:hypothetical protein
MENHIEFNQNHAVTQGVSLFLLIGAAAAEGFRTILESVHSQYAYWLEFLTLVSLTLVIFINLEKAILLALKYAKGIYTGLRRLVDVVKLKK